VDYQRLIRDEVRDLVAYAPGLRASQLRMRTGKDRIVKLSSNEHPSGPTPQAARAIRAMVDRVNRYPDGSGRALKRRIATWLDVPCDNIVIGAGSNEIIRLVAQAVLRPGDEVVFGWPSFVVYPMVCQMFGAIPMRVPLTEDDGYDLDAIADAITDRTRLVFLCNPNNPTGTIYHRLAFDRFLDRIPDEVLLVVDEAYFEFVTDEHYPNALEYFDCKRPICVLRTFSKIYSLAGIRIGYGVVPESVRVAIDKLREPFNTSAIAQIAAYYSIQEYDEIERRRYDNLAGRQRLCDTLDTLGLDYAVSQANFVYLRTDDPQTLFGALLDEGVIVRDFGDHPALRITIGDPEEMNIAIAAFHSIGERLGFA